MEFWRGMSQVRIMELSGAVLIAIGGCRTQTEPGHGGLST